MALVITCEMNTPSAPRDNPDDGLNPEFIPQILNIDIGYGGNQTENPVNIHISVSGAAGAVNQVQIGQVNYSGAALNAAWQTLDSTVSLNFTGAFGTKWLAVKVKALNGNESAIFYHSFTLGINTPSNLTALPNETGITLNWQDNSIVEQGYKIERKTAGGTYTQIDSTNNANVETYPDTMVTYGTTYYYRVRAYNAQWNSNYSNEEVISFVITFSRTFGGFYYDEGWSVQQTNDDGYIIAGYTASYGAGSEDVYLIKTDASGNEQWSQTFGGIFSDYGESVQQTTDGGYIIAGRTYSYGSGSTDVYLIKTDAYGNEIWSKTFGGISSDYSRSVQQTYDGGFIIAGLTYSYGYSIGYSDVYLIKTDANGNETWTKTYGGYYDDFGFNLQQTYDGGFIIAGKTYSYGAFSENVYLIKTDALGNQIWSKTFNGNGYGYGRSVRQTTDGGYIIIGKTYAISEYYSDIYLVKTDVNGNETWSQTYGGMFDDVGFSVQQTSDFGYIITGKSSIYGNFYYDVCLIKTDALGNQQWSKTFGGSSDDWGYSVRQTSDGGYIIAGWTSSYGAGSSDVWLIKTDSQGNVNE